MTQATEATEQPGGVDFSVYYDGPALADHAMDVRDLAPALLALEQVFTRANTLLNADQTPIVLEIRAFSQGSFEVFLGLKQAIDVALDLFSSSGWSAVANLKEVVFGGPTIVEGLLHVIKSFRGYEAVEVSKQTDGIVLEVGKLENLRLVIPTQIAELYRDAIIRRDMMEVLLPLQREGIERVEFRDHDKVLESVTKEESAYFNVDTERLHQVSRSILHNQLLNVVSVTFTNGKWKLSDGEKSRWYTINDSDFVQKVDEGLERFGSHDILICDVSVVQLFNENGKLKIIYEIIRVHEHAPAIQQMAMFSEERTA